MSTTEVKPVVPQDVKGIAASNANQTPAKVEVLSTTHKSNHMVELKKVVSVANKCIAHLAQSRICPKLLGNSKALTQQVKSVEVTLDKIEARLAKAIIAKTPKP